MFRDRSDAGVRLAWELGRYKDRSDAHILAIPRGGMPVGGALARELGLGLHAALSHRIPHPTDERASIGAVTLDAVELDPVARTAPADYLAAMIARQREDLRRRYWAYHEAAPPPATVEGRVVILTDDEASTGGTMSAAIRRLRREGAARIVAALPAATTEAASRLHAHVDEFICLRRVDDAADIPSLYADFSRVTEEEALEVLRWQARPSHH